MKKESKFQTYEEFMGKKRTYRPPDPLRRLKGCVYGSHQRLLTETELVELIMSGKVKFADRDYLPSCFNDKNWQITLKYNPKAEWSNLWYSGPTEDYHFDAFYDRIKTLAKRYLQAARENLSKKEKHREPFNLYG